MPTHTIDRDRSQAPTVYRNARQVRARYAGLSDMTLWRWLHDGDLGFPQPIRINGRRFWKEDDLTAWERTQVALRAHQAERDEPEPA